MWEYTLATLHSSARIFSYIRMYTASACLTNKYAGIKFILSHGVCERTNRGHSIAATDVGVLNELTGCGQINWRDTESCIVCGTVFLT